MKHLDEGRLQAWVDRDRSGLDPGEIAEIEAHLSACPECASQAEALASEDAEILELLAPTPAGQAPAPDFDDVLARRDALRARPRRGWRNHAGLWAASITVALSAGWMLNEASRRTAGPTEVLPVEAPATAEETASPVPNDAQGVDDDFAGTAEERVDADAGPRPGAPSGQLTVPAAASVEASTGAASEPAPPAPEADATARSLLETAGGAPAATVANDAVTVASDAAADPVTPAAARAREAEPTVSESAPVRAAARPTTDMAAGVVGAEREDTPDSGGGAGAVSKAIVGDQLSGRVVDESGRPLEAVQVFVAGTSVGALTSADGSFRLRLPEALAPAGDSFLTVEIRQIGYSPARAPVSSEEPGPLEVRLSEQALTLDEVVVTGRATDERPEPAAADADVNDDAIEVGDRTIWTVINRVNVAAVTGMPVPPLGDRTAGSVWFSSVGGAFVVRAAFELEDGTPVTVYQAERRVHVPGEVIPAGHGSADVESDGLHRVAVGPLPADRLAALLREGG